MLIDKIYVVVSAIIRNEKVEVLFLKRSKKSKLFKYYWQLPEGKLEEGENILDCLYRELLEELKLKCNRANFRTHSIVHFKGNGTHFLVFRIVFTVKNPKTIQLSDEHVEYCWLTPQKALKELKLVPGIKEILSDLVRR